MESKQNDNKDYVVVYDLCDKAGKVLKKMQKNDIPEKCIIDEGKAKEKFDGNKPNATEVNNEEQEYYYIDLYNNKLFAKVPSNKCSYNPFYGFTVKTDKPMKGTEMNFSYSLKTGKNLFENGKNIDGILLHVGGNDETLFFNKEGGRFSYYTDMSIDHNLEYQISLEKFLSDDNPSFNLFRSSYWENLFHQDEHGLGLKKTGSFAKLFGVADDGNNRCGVGCFSCGKVMVNNDNDNYYHYKYNALGEKQYDIKLSLDYVSKRICINHEYWN